MASRLSPALFALLVFLGVYLTVVAANGATRRKKKIHHKKSSGTTDLDKLETETMPLHQAQMLDSRAKLGAKIAAARPLRACYQGWGALGREPPNFLLAKRTIK